MEDFESLDEKRVHGLTTLELPVDGLFSGERSPLLEPGCHRQLVSTFLQCATRMRWAPLLVPRGSKYLTFEASGSKNHTFDGCWDQSPEILGIWTLWGIASVLYPDGALAKQARPPKDYRGLLGPTRVWFDLIGSLFRP